MNEREFLKAQESVRSALLSLMKVEQNCLAHSELIQKDLQKAYLMTNQAARAIDLDAMSKVAEQFNLIREQAFALDAVRTSGVAAALEQVTDWQRTLGESVATVADQVRIAQSTYAHVISHLAQMAAGSSLVAEAAKSSSQDLVDVAAAVMRESLAETWSTIADQPTIDVAADSETEQLVPEIKDPPSWLTPDLVQELILVATLYIALLMTLQLLGLDEPIREFLSR